MSKQIRNDKALHKIAEKFKELRKATGKLQKEVEGDTHINIGNIEAAQLNLSVQTLERLCRYYGISLADFCREIEL